jgi:hypothetical protein
MRCLLIAIATTMAASQAFAGAVTLGKDPAADRRAAHGTHFGRYSAADTNRDSVIDRDEWAAYKSKTGKRLPKFSTIDRNHNGFISPREMVEYKNRASRAG